MTTPNTKIRYIQDLRNPDRVMTLVTQIKGSSLYIAYSVNKPPHWVTEPGPLPDTFFTYLIPGEVFDREKGKKIALGRLKVERSRYVEHFDGETHPLVLALTAIATDLRQVNIVGRRIARHELEALPFGQPAEPECNAAEDEHLGPCCGRCKVPEIAPTPPQSRAGRMAVMDQLEAAMRAGVTKTIIRNEERPVRPSDKSTVRRTPGMPLGDVTQALGRVHRDPGLPPGFVRITGGSKFGTEVPMDLLAGGGKIPRPQYPRR
jgi:hypothetical protein